MRKGWICLHRCIQEHWIWQDANRFKWWVDLLLRANNKDAKVLIDGSLVDCKRGQFITSLGKLAEEWMVSRDTVRRFLDALESDTMIARKSTHKMTQITICNYDSYQDIPTTDNTTDRQQNDTQAATQMTQITDCNIDNCADEPTTDRQLTQQQTDTNNNVDSITTSSNTSTNSNREGGKKTQAKFIPPTLEEVIAYYKEKGFVKTNPEAFFHHYNTVGWMVNKNKMKCWKSALAKWEAREYDNKPKQSNQSNPNKAQYRNPQAVYSSESDI
jgi:DNA-binding transcriptional regulator YhcF (GntR family)